MKIGKTRFTNIYIDILTIITNVLIVFYLYNLEDATCDCVIDWRYYFLKYVSSFLIIWEFIILYLTYISPDIFDKYYLLYHKTRYYIFGIYIINYIILYNYVSELNATKCVCAVENQPMLNKFLYYWRYLPLILIVLILLFPVLFILNLAIRGSF
jgi:hypothetical protein